MIHKLILHNFKLQNLQFKQLIDDITIDILEILQTWSI